MKWANAFKSWVKTCSQDEKRFVWQLSMFLFGIPSGLFWAIGMIYFMPDIGQKPILIKALFVVGSMFILGPIMGWAWGKMMWLTFVSRIESPSEASQADPNQNRVLIDVYFGVFDGEEYSYGLTEADACAAVESSFRFGEPDPTDPDDMSLGNTWATESGERGWRIVKRTIPMVRIHAAFSGTPDEPCHASWQCPVCDRWIDEDIEFDAKGPILGYCGWSPEGKDPPYRIEAHDIWFFVTW